MQTEVVKLKAALEARGDHLHLANADSGWFAIAPRKWHQLVERARREGRDGPNLIVYRTKTTDPHDHYALPFAVVRDLLTDATAPRRVDGSRRWELTLRAGRLRVTHGEHDIDVGAYYGLPLAAAASGDERATLDPQELDARTRRLRKAAFPRPIGTRQPHKVIVDGRAIFARRPDVKAWVLREAQGRCELCGSPAPFVDAEGDPFLELHHVQQLAAGGPDTVENAVAVCPNCHRRLHHARERDDEVDRLRAKVARLVPG